MARKRDLAGAADNLVGADNAAPKAGTPGQIQIVPQGDYDPVEFLIAPPPSPQQIKR
jgi:hypothetical protein